MITTPPGRTTRRVLSQGLGAIRRLREVVERAEQQHGVCSLGHTREVPGVSEFGRQIAQVLAPSCLCHVVHMSLDRLDHVNREAALGERHRVGAGAAADVQDSTRRQRQMSIEQLQRPDVLETRSPVDEQTRTLESEVVVRSNVRIDHAASFTHRRPIRVRSCSGAVRSRLNGGSAVPTSRRAGVASGARRFAACRTRDARRTASPPRPRPVGGRPPPADLRQRLRAPPGSRRPTPLLPAPRSTSPSGELSAGRSRPLMRRGVHSRTACPVPSPLRTNASVGSGRLVGDGTFHCFVVDLMVSPEHQGAAVLPDFGSCGSRHRPLSPRSEIRGGIQITTSCRVLLSRSSPACPPPPSPAVGWATPRRHRSQRRWANRRHCLLGGTTRRWLEPGAYRGEVVA